MRSQAHDLSPATGKTGSNPHDHNFATRLAHPYRAWRLYRRLPGASEPQPVLEVAEGVGFEPTNLTVSGFQDRRFQPLTHPSESD